MSDHIYLNDLSRTYTCHQVRVQGQNTNSPGFVYTMEESVVLHFFPYFLRKTSVLWKKTIFSTVDRLFMPSSLYL